MYAVAEDRAGNRSQPSNTVTFTSRADITAPRVVVEIASISNRLKVTLLGEDEPGGSGLDGVFFPLADELGFRVYDRPFLVPTGLSCSSMPPMLQATSVSSVPWLSHR